MLTEETIARVNGGCPSRFRSLKHGLDIEISRCAHARNLDRCVPGRDVRTLRVILGVDGDDPIPLVPGCGCEADGDFAAVGDKECFHNAGSLTPKD